MFSENWYSCQICNQTKLNTWNKETLQRNFPDSKMPPVFDPRPDFKIVRDTYFVQPTGVITDTKKNIITTKPNEIISNDNYTQNLHPFRKDRDCFFNKLPNSLDPGKPDEIEFLKRIDVDSYSRGLTQILTKGPTEKTNPYCVYSSMCKPNQLPVENTPQVVKIINNWNAPNARFQIPYTTNLIQTPQFYNGCPGIPIEHAFNNRTKQLDQAPIDYHAIRVSFPMT